MTDQEAKQRLDEAKSRVSLIGLFDQDGHKLKRAGTRLKCLCPFHDESSPSCFVDADRFHCFGCGADGDVLDYIQRRDGNDFIKAKTTLEKLAGISPPVAATKRSAAAPQAQQRAAYAMTASELGRCVSMAEALLSNPQAIKGIAKARGWHPKTIRELALDPCIGLHENKLVLIYPTGAKIRHKPLTPDAAEKFEGDKFKWLFGKPDSLWRGDRLLKCTETVHLTEGESAAITLINAGLDNGTREIAMAVPGANGWRNEWAGMFRGRTVVLWPDADKPGQELKDQIIQSVAHYAKSIEVVPVDATHL